MAEVELPVGGSGDGDAYDGIVIVAAVVAITALIPVVLTLVVGLGCGFLNPVHVVKPNAGSRRRLCLSIVQHPVKFWRWVCTEIVYAKMWRRSRHIRVGSPFKDATVYNHTDGSATRLSAFIEAGKPLVLNFGSWS